jgi:hypothetical protein
MTAADIGSILNKKGMITSDRQTDRGSTTFGRRLACAVALGIAYALLTYGMLVTGRPGLQANDFTYPWLAARAMLHGDEPYAYVAGQATPWGGALFYPLTAAIAVMPLAGLPVRLAGSLFVGVGAGTLAFFVSRQGLWRLAIFASAPALRACGGVQWSPLLTAAALCPGLLGFAACKPNLLLPLLAYHANRRAIVYCLLGCVVLAVPTLVFDITWPVKWLAALRMDPMATQYRAPLLTMFGWPLALAVLRWRHPDAKLLLAMAIVPQNAFFYEQLPLMLIPGSPRQLLLMCATSITAWEIGINTLPRQEAVQVWSDHFYPFMIAGVYLPALVFVLMSRTKPDDRPVRQPAEKA